MCFQDCIFTSYFQVPNCSIYFDLFWGFYTLHTWHRTYGWPQVVHSQIHLVFSIIKCLSLFKPRLDTITLLRAIPSVTLLRQSFWHIIWKYIWHICSDFLFRHYLVSILTSYFASFLASILTFPLAFFLIIYLSFFRSSLLALYLAFYLRVFQWRGKGGRS